MTPKAFLVFLHLTQKYLDAAAWPLAFKHTPEETAKDYYQHTLCRVASQDKPLFKLKKHIASFTTPDNLQLFQCDNRLWAYVLVNAFQNTSLCPEINTPRENLSTSLKKLMLKIPQKHSNNMNISNIFLSGLLNHQQYQDKAIEIFQTYLDELKESNQTQSIEALHSLFYYLRSLCLEQDSSFNQESLKTLSMHFSAALVSALQIEIFKDQKIHLAQLYQFSAAINYCLLTSDLFTKPYSKPLSLKEFVSPFEKMNIEEIITPRKNEIQLIRAFRTPKTALNSNYASEETKKHKKKFKKINIF